MTNYKVIIIETLSRVVDVEASSEEMAMRVVKRMYRDEEITLDYADFDDVEFRANKD
jgi:hypothetical protein